MIRLAYKSVAADDLASGEIFSIVRTSARNNATVAVTGFLLFSGGRFFQIIEGPTVSINSVMRKVERDPRHHSIEVFHRDPIDHRAYPMWRMNRITVPERPRSLSDILPELADSPTPVAKALNDFFDLTDA